MLHGDGAARGLSAAIWNFNGPKNCEGYHLTSTYIQKGLASLFIIKYWNQRQMFTCVIMCFVSVYTLGRLVAY